MRGRLCVAPPRRRPGTSAPGARPGRWKLKTPGPGSGRDQGEGITAAASGSAPGRWRLLRSVGAATGRQPSKTAGAVGAHRRRARIARYGRESPSVQRGCLIGSPGPGLRRWCRLLDVFPARPNLRTYGSERPAPGCPGHPRRTGRGAAKDRKRQEPRAEFIRRSVMALNLSQKKEVVAELADVAANAHSLIAAEYAGTTVEQMTAMRKKARET